ncbi:hypothetical protein NLM24_30460 [Nocardia zapadnayensis]|nr:hypothetical protein [Nocardia zapadnayensis]MCX0274943.1 hypothetical protein [Nocardia zapadnayensis]
MTDDLSERVRVHAGALHTRQIFYRPAVYFAYYAIDLGSRFIIIGLRPPGHRPEPVSEQFSVEVGEVTGPCRQHLITFGLPTNSL